MQLLVVGGGRVGAVVVVVAVEVAVAVVVVVVEPIGGGRVGAGGHFVHGPNSLVGLCKAILLSKTRPGLSIERVRRKMELKARHNTSTSS